MLHIKCFLKKLNPANVQRTLLKVSEQTGHKNSQSDDISGHQTDFNIGSISA